MQNRIALVARSDLEKKLNSQSEITGKKIAPVINTDLKQIKKMGQNPQWNTL
jgi:hypothetical protein